MLFNYLLSHRLTFSKNWLTFDVCTRAFEYDGKEIMTVNWIPLNFIEF